MPKNIVFTFHPDGRVESEAEGFPGRTCEAASREFEKELGRLTGPRKPKRGIVVRHRDQSVRG